MRLPERARMFAIAAHQHQMYGLYPYVFHLDQVAEFAMQVNSDEATIAACYLHDVLEDCPVSYNDIAEEFGTRVADIVYAVTDELGKTRKERHEKTYPKIAADKSAIIVKLCDRAANLTESLRNGKMLKKYVDEHVKLQIALGRLEDKRQNATYLWGIVDDLIQKAKTLI